MKILILGDVMGPSGVDAIKKKLPDIINKRQIDFVILNGENAGDNGVGITKKIFDVHLMISPVDNFVKDFADAGADIITFHPEATSNVSKTIKLIREQNKKVGISLKPKSEINLIENYISEIDLVLIMSVEPGFGGQKFIPEVLRKTKAVRDLINRKKLSVDVEIDGKNKTAIKLLVKDFKF